LDGGAGQDQPHTQPFTTPSRCRRWKRPQTAAAWWWKPAAYDDGVAFRYVVPEQPSIKELRILNEATQFRFSKYANTFSLISRGFETKQRGRLSRADHRRPASGVPRQPSGPRGSAWYRMGRSDGSRHRRLFQHVRHCRGRPDAHGPAGGPGEENPNSNAEIAPSFPTKEDRSKVSVIAQTPVRSALACVDDRRSTRTAGGIQHGAQFESALRHRRPLPGSGPARPSWDWWNGSQAKGVAKPGMNNDTMKYLHRLLRAQQVRVPADRRRLAGSLLRPAVQVGSGQYGGLSNTQSIPAIDIPMLVA